MEIFPKFHHDVYIYITMPLLSSQFSFQKLKTFPGQRRICNLNFSETPEITNKQASLTGRPTTLE